MATRGQAPCCRLCDTLGTKAVLPIYAEYVKPRPLRTRRGSCYPNESAWAWLDTVTASDSESRCAVVEAFGSAPFAAVRPVGSYWDSVTNWFSYRPTSARYRKRLGAAHQLEISLGRESPSRDWMSVETTARGEYDRQDAGDGRYTQVLTHDHRPEHKARAKLNDAVMVPINLQRLRRLETGERRRMEDEHDRRIKAVRPEEVSVPVDGMSVAFTVVRLAGFTAASATLPDRTITAWGRFDDRDLTLQSIDDITPYLSSTDDWDY
jgi:hypothetical protein